MEQKKIVTAYTTNPGDSPCAYIEYSDGSCHTMSGEVIGFTEYTFTLKTWGGIYVEDIRTGNSFTRAL